MPQSLAPYRVFISYSHEDRPHVEKIVKVVGSLGLTPLWDRSFQVGEGFHEQIKTFIAHSHVFMPIITETSSKRGWVHQEIGYATALNVPVLPVCIGRMPGQMIQILHAVFLGSDPIAATRPRNLQQILRRTVFDQLLERAQSAPDPLFQCADLPERRATLLAGYANQVHDLGAHGHLRQKEGLSSLHIPAQPLSDIMWRLRYGRGERSEYHLLCQRNERLALEKHARQAGCSLIIAPYIDFDMYYGPPARRVRLQCLLKFLESMDDDHCFVAARNKGSASIADPAAISQPRTIGSHSRRTTKTIQGHSLTILGDWFLAESVSGTPGRGYHQTIFTRHAPYVMHRINEFDEELDSLLHERKWPRRGSRRAAVKLILKLLEDLPQVG